MDIKNSRFKAVIIVQSQIQQQTAKRLHFRLFSSAAAFLQAKSIMSSHKAVR